MSAQTALKHGDFTGLAENYALYRPGYSETVLSAIFGVCGKAPSQMDIADIGAGTGIWTRMLATQLPKSIIAVEPNSDMRRQGQEGNGKLAIEWREGSAEHTGLTDHSVDLLSMASSFHWVDFDRSTTEFHRLLRKGGHFVALWNPRYLQDSPMLLEIEARLAQIKPDMQRISSGSSAFVEQLTARFANHGLFEDPVYIEGRHTARLSPAQYIGVWNSVNDIRAQLGEARFSEFMRFVESRIEGCAHIDCSYLTRAWIVRVKA